MPESPSTRLESHNGYAVVTVGVGLGNPNFSATLRKVDSGGWEILKIS